MRERWIKAISVTPTVTLDAYTAADVVGGLITFEVRGGPASGEIRRIRLVDDANQKEQFTLLIHNDTPSTIANDAAYAPVVADLAMIIDEVVVATADWSTWNGNAVAMIAGYENGEMHIPFHTEDGNLYVYAVATDTPDYVAATDLTIIMDVEVWY